MLVTEYSPISAFGPGEMTLFCDSNFWNITVSKYDSIRYASYVNGELIAIDLTEDLARVKAIVHVATEATVERVYKSK